ncbi:PREDICTED: sialic acid-binding Ig-like lectin 11 isoform X1 [Capra hircus]|uniref:sialic acid-binding Ig-like lectin 11 isoform X1 n=1 Tax=Capra hircus TaxID=9925 RepID=UPI0008468CB9|nr:PREDICTED: sialic acid-binding Ig-like lectin 11 isoform X1 [Capra hircus]
MERLLLLPLLWAGSLEKESPYQLQVRGPVTVQEGLCVSVPCNVSYPPLGRAESTRVYGAWFRKGDRLQEDVLVATDNSARGGKKKRNIPFHLLGDPRANNCSLGIAEARKRDSGNYYFQLTREAAEHNYKNNQLTVNVISTEGSPGAEVREGGKDGPCPSISEGGGGQWPTVRPGWAHTGVPLGVWPLRLSSPALTWTPDVHIEEPLESGSSSHLKCSLPEACDWATPPTISWTGAALRPLGLDSKEAYNSSEILLTPRPQDHGSSLTCRVTFRRASVSAERTVTLNVSYPPQKLTISISRGIGTELKHLGNGSSLPVLEGDSLRLACDTDSNPPATLSWSQGSQTLSPSHPSSPGVLYLPRVESGHEGELTCRAQHPRGSLWISVHLSVQTPPQLLGPSCSQEDEGLRCSCSSRARPAPSLHWWLGEGLLAGELSNASFEVTSSSNGPWANSSLSLREGLSSGLSLSCEALNVHGARSGSVLLLPGKPRLGGEFVLGAIGGAGAAGLLSLCSCLIFFRVKTCRKAAREKDEPGTLGPTSQGYQDESPPGSPLAYLPPAVATPLSGEDQELHYASLSFLELRPWEPRDQAASSTTEYAEVKILKR